MHALRVLYCRTFHGYRSVQFAGGRTYRCASCGCVFECPWVNEERNA